MLACTRYSARRSAIHVLPWRSDSGMTATKRGAAAWAGDAAPTPPPPAAAAAALPPADGMPEAAFSSRPRRQRLLAPLPPGRQPASCHSGRVGGSGGYTELEPGEHVLPGGGRIFFDPSFVLPAAAADLFAALKQQIAWQQRSVRVMGRTVMQPRLVAYQADGSELAYTYSGLRLEPERWHPSIASLKQRVEAATGAAFNSCLLNFYRSGADSIGWHSDSEPLYGREPTIATVSLGDARDFLLRRNADHSERCRFRLGGGALLVMSGPVQEQWMHSVPKRAGAVGERVSLTFRLITRPERGA